MFGKNGESGMNVVEIAVVVAVPDPNQEIVTDLSMVALTV